MTHIITGVVRIWIAQWEYQCCGAPIAVGQTVDLTVHRSEWPRPWWKAIGETVELVAEHHLPDGDVWHVRVHVEQLWEARARWEPRGGEGQFDVAPDSGEIAPITLMKVWDEEWRPSRRGGEPAGWILRGTIVRDLPERRLGTPYGGSLSADLTERPGRVTRLADVLAASTGETTVPLLGAWQPRRPDPAGEFEPGQPCVVTWVHQDVCRASFVTPDGLFAASRPLPLADVIVLGVEDFTRRAAQLEVSTWSGFHGEHGTRDSIHRYGALFPDGIPRPLRWFEGERPAGPTGPMTR